jgi:hypothetical protein
LIPEPPSEARLPFSEEFLASQPPYNKTEIN